MVLDSEYENLLKDVLNGAKSIYERKLVQKGEGNISARISNLNELIITPTLNDYKTLDLNDLVHLNFNGQKISHGREASSEYRLHVALYQARPRAKYVIHTHSPYASMFSIARKSIPVLFEEMVIFLGGSIPISDFGRANTYEIADTAIKGMADKNAVLMANHGVLACARTIDDAVKIVELVEKMAKIYWGALQIGNVVTIEESACNQFKDKFDQLFATHNEKAVSCK